MKLKRFIAADTRSAMQQIKATFGPDAVILSSAKVEGGIEVVAAIDFDESMLSSDIACAEAQPPRPVSAQNSHSPMDEMRQEISTLRSMLETQMRGFGMESAPLLAVLTQQLMVAGTSYVSAQALTKDIDPTLSKDAAWQQVLAGLGQSISIRDSHRIEEGGIYAFVGATGVGKTTTLAKIAARFVLRFGAEQLGLVTMDTYRIAAEEQLMLYGKILGVPVSVAHDEASLGRVIRQLGGKKLILIDTAGMNPADSRVSGQMDLLSSRLHSLSNVLVLPATSHYQVLKEAIACYGPSRLDQCIITKLDESRAIGGVLSALLESGLAASYLTHGQRVPEDIKLATRHQLIEHFAHQEQAIEKRSRLTAEKQVAGSAYSYE
ncbi:MAG: flagellar biosynthesis protein FlhF [Legionellaceae bacterium]|nr:flagellar biosynthesis protein FlhF [Legionellaceae bacterium]